MGNLMAARCGACLKMRFAHFGFTLAACMGLNLIAASIVGGFFAVINYRIKILALQKAAPAAASAAAAEFDDDEEEI